jgi:hypothetical protein
MEDYILDAYNEAYEKKETCNLFVITTILEKMLKRGHSGSNAGAQITVNQVRQVLEHNGLSYSIGPVTQVG